VAGIASNPISVNQSKAYGDQKQLDKLKSGLTTTPMTGVPTPASSAGRPPTSGGGSSPASASGAGPQQGQEENVPPEHQKLFSRLAQSMKAAQLLMEAAQRPDAGPWTRFYADVAQQQYKALAEKTRTETPFFNGV
jgi:hypothetical protein